MLCLDAVLDRQRAARGAGIGAAMIETIAPVRRAQTAETLALAFQDDPALSWILRDKPRRLRVLPRFFDWMFDDHRRHGMITGSAGGEVAAYWRLPGKVHHEDPLALRDLITLAGVFGFALPRGYALGEAIHGHVPAGENQLYLRFVGVRPDCQGKGWGGRAIRAGIAEAQRRGVGVCLETATPANVDLYRALGFAVVDEWVVPRGGPRFWTMVRPTD
jgi:ribosomal protein S18 acetylase RimI-like enzyme